MVEKVSIKSSCFGLNITYSPEEPSTNPNGCPVFIEPLFDLAKSDCFEEVSVYLTSHNEAYISNGKTKTEATGWVSLNTVGNGGGYMGDKSIYLE